MDRHHLFPWWMGYLLSNPIRRLRDNPETMLGSYVKPGMTVLDAGCAMGFFSIPMARMVGPSGRVICIDLQRKMISSLIRRACKKGLSSIIEGRVCTRDSLTVSDLAGRIDFALAYAVIHEITDPIRFISEIYRTLKKNGLLLVGEPSHVVSSSCFTATKKLVLDCGFEHMPGTDAARLNLLLFAKPGYR